MSRHRQMWLNAGVLTAGIGAALIAAPGPACADDGADRGSVSAGHDAAPARAHRTAGRGEGSHDADSTIRPPAGLLAEVEGARDVELPVAATGAAAQETVSSPTFGSDPAVSDLAGSDPAVFDLAGSPTPAVAPADPGPVQSAVTAAQAYIYGYPLMEYQRVRQAVGTVNTLHSLTSFANPDVDPIWRAIGGGKRPNVDTFYTLAELDLSHGPVVLSVPDMGSRYFSFQLTDPYTNVSSYIGSRTTGYGPGKYAITWTGGPQTEIPGAQTVLVPYTSMLALGRTLAGDEADQQQAIAVMKQYALEPTGGAVDPVIDIPGTGLGYLDAISAAMEINPPPAADAPALASMARIGVGPGLRVADAHLGLLSMLAADLAVRATAALLPLLTSLNQYAAAVQNRGWATPDPAIGDYGTEYLLRAGVAEAGLLANTPDEAVYSAGLLDKNLLPLNGFGPGYYLLHFAPGKEPPAGAFWSVTVYDSAGNLVPNAQQRYDVSSSRPDELVRQPDGSVDIVFAPQDPHVPGANWLKVPACEGFSAYLRVYVPGESVLDGTWMAPAIQRRWI